MLVLVSMALLRPVWQVIKQSIKGAPFWRLLWSVLRVMHGTGVVGFLAVCTLVGLLLWKHRHWWSGSNGNGSRDGSLDKEEGSGRADQNP